MFVVGRSSSCNLALDDGLVSRRHACFHIGVDGVNVEDLGSRNGILLNGEPCTGLKPMNHLDKVTVGSTELVLIEVFELSDASRCDRCGSALGPRAVLCAKCGAPTPRATATLAGVSVPRDTMPIHMSDAPLADEMTSSRDLLFTIADKAMVLGKFDEADRMLQKPLADLLTRAKTGSPPTSSRMQDAVQLALRLADGLRKHNWIDWVFDLHLATQKLLTVQEIDRLHELVRKVRYPGSSVMRAYIERMRGRVAELSPGERFLVQRLEGIERVVSA